MAQFVNINGQLTDSGAAGIPHDNRAFRYGHGLFETMLFEDGRIALEDLHWKRLFDGMHQLYFELPKLFTPQFLAAEVLRTVRKNKMEALCRLRLQVWPGTGGLYDASAFAPSFLIECFPLQKELLQLNENGLECGIATGLAKSMDTLANLKSCNALIYSIAARQSKVNKWNDALILNTAGRLAESTICNVFWIKDQIVYTPPLAEGCIAGVMRQHLLHTLPNKGFPLIEEPLTLDGLLHADELLLSNSIRKIKWIKQLDAKSYKLKIGLQLAGLV